ncbi:MAG: dTMP kinase [Candidatus Omnitrophica bacterium]|nr:dTMP kinase [Candidatus Omnitrophota bacterium]MCF7877125.1 dTMP kinase [Candidatus Omnitrophota bacterium]MCF7878734.1 dTMP kinase [Candidatus Omnitrophota bacterium]MCF7892801.1 dTMP kinase [Candidatus Omnitrophota bacterium]
MAEKVKEKKAVFITVEGLEGCGKSSVIKFLEDYAKKEGIKTQVYREPGSTKIGEEIRKILLDKKEMALSAYAELLLYLAARAQLIEERLKEDLSRFDIIICDRFYDSTLVYQGYALGLGGIAEKSVELFSLGIKPDLTLFLDVDVEVGLKRIKRKDRIESRPLSFHKKLRQGFLKLSRREPSRIKVVDASGSLSDIYSQVKEILAKEKISKCI